jgi:hypothetical protein
MSFKRFMMAFGAVIVISALFRDASAAKQVLHRISITGNEDLIFKEGDNPCRVLSRYCKSLRDKFNFKECFGQLHSIALQQLTALWLNVGDKLKADETFFIDCEPIKYDRSHFTPGVSLPHSASTPGHQMDTRNSSGIIREMLEYLKRAMQRDMAALQTFNARRNQLKLTDSERIDLYKQAILLIPNNLFLVDQFGLALMYNDIEDKARVLFNNAVARGLWGNPLQRPVSKYVPGLTALPWHDKSKYAFIKKLEDGYRDIKEELLLNLKDKKHLFTEEGENLHVGGDWTELRIKSSGLGFTDKSNFFPKTMEHILNCGQQFTSIKFSAIQPGTHIRTHTGPTNERLRIHLTLIHQGGARIRVGTEWHTWIEGQAIIFDDSWEHEVIHTGDSIRAVLILDIWHPELPESQRIVH